MSCIREFTISDNDSNAICHQQNIKAVLEKVPDLENDEIECIISLQKNESITWGNITIIRTN